MTTEKSQKEEKEDENHGKNYKNWRSRRRAAIAEAHHFFAPPPPLFALKRKIVKIKKRLETSFFSSTFRYILCIFFNVKRQAFCGAPVLFAVIVPWGRLAP